MDFETGISKLGKWTWHFETMSEERSIRGAINSRQNLYCSYIYKGSGCCWYGGIFVPVCNTC